MARKARIEKDAVTYKERAFGHVWNERGIITYGSGVIVQENDSSRKYRAVCIDHRPLIYFKTDEKALEHSREHPFHIVHQICVEYSG